MFGLITKAVKVAYKWKLIKTAFDEIQDVNNQFGVVSDQYQAARADGNVTADEEARIFEEMMKLSREMFQAQRVIRALFD